MGQLRALEAYLQVAALGSVTGAAHRLGVSQPSVSRMIQDLERDLGQPLFERAGQRLVLTPKGMLLRGDAERALDAFRRLKDRAREAQDGAPEEAPVRVAAVSALAFGLLTPAWRAAGARLEVAVATPDRVQSAVVRGQAEVGATSAPLLHRDLAVEWLGTAPCLLAVPEGDRLARAGGPVALEALEGRTVVAMSEARGVSARIRAALATAGVRVETAVRTTSTMSALAFVRAGAGAAIVEPLTLAGGALPGVRLLPLATAIPYCFGLVTPRGAAVSGAARALIAGMRAEAGRLADFTPVPPEAHAALLAGLSEQETP